MTRRVEDIVRRVEALPGVLSVDGVEHDAARAAAATRRPSCPKASRSRRARSRGRRYFGVTPHLFKTLNVPIVAGRDFTDADGVGKSPVAIVNGVLARRLWPNRADVIGQRFRMLNDKTSQWITVVGRGGRFPALHRAERQAVAYAFMSYPYSPARNTGLTIRVAGGSPASIAGAVRRQIRAVGSDAAACSTCRPATRRG